MLTIKIILSIKKTIPSKHYLQFLPFKKAQFSFYEKKFI